VGGEGEDSEEWDDDEQEEHNDRAQEGEHVPR
jgi:hypothetical protein